jgi:LysM repeat protein
MASWVERYAVLVGMLVPVAIAVLAVQMLGRLDAPVFAGANVTEPQLVTKRPTAFNMELPPTLVPPTAVPQATDTPASTRPTARPSPTVAKGLTYTVKPGDQLKHIAAAYGVSIWKIVEINDIPNPDGLRVGQELKIPDS